MNHYQGPLKSAVITKFVFTVTARGTNPSGGGSTDALMKFKVTAQGVFVQQ